MTTTPTFWGSEVTFSNDVLAYGPKITTLADGTFILAWENGDDIFARHLNETGSFTGGNDRLFGSESVDILHGGSGQDRLRGCGMS